MNIWKRVKTRKYTLVFLILFFQLNSVKAQFNPDFFPQFTAYSGNPIIRYGDGFTNAAWNDPSVLKVGSQYIMYTTAANGIFLTDSNEVKVYRQVSTDGINWTLSPITPVLEPLNGTYYDGGTETPSVLIKDGVYHMYTTCYPPGNDALTYVIGHAVSSDGISWTMDASPIIESNVTNVFYSEIVGEPGAIVYHDSIFVYFSAAGIVSGNSVQGIACMKSADGSTFGAPEMVLTLPTDVYSSPDYWGLSTPSALAINDSIYVFTDVAQTINGQWTQVALHQFKTDGSSGIWYHESLPIHHMQDFTWTDGNYLSNLLAPCPLLDDDGTLRIWYAGQNVADIVGTDTLYNVYLDTLGNIQVLPEYYGIGTSSFQFQGLNVTSEKAIELVQVFPNPTTGSIQVSLPPDLKNTQLTIVNSLGQIVKDQIFLTEEINLINLNDLENGLYFFKVENSFGSSSLKVELRK
jgi:Secretion system C-terminal sorting domain